MPAIPIPDLSGGTAPPRTTWRNLLSDPYTTMCGLAAGASVLAALDWHNPSAWVSAAIFAVWGAVQADARRRQPETSPTPPAKEGATSDPSRS